MSVKDLSPAALAAYMRGGSAEWGQWGSIVHHALYVEPIGKSRRRNCLCGCRKRSTHRLMANGVCMSTGCELHMRRLARQGSGA